MEPGELAQILNAHRLWLNSNGKQGQRATGEHDFSEKDLTGAPLSKALLTNSNFTKAILRDVNLKKASLVGAVFKGANLQNAILQDADLISADFTEATLTHANLQRASLRCATFERARLDGGTRLREADLRNADLEGALYLQTAQLAATNSFNTAVGTGTATFWPSAVLPNSPPFVTRRST